MCSGNTSLTQPARHFHWKQMRNLWRYYKFLTEVTIYLDVQGTWWEKKGRLWKEIISCLKLSPQSTRFFVDHQSTAASKLSINSAINCLKFHLWSMGNPYTLSHYYTIICCDRSIQIFCSITRYINQVFTPGELTHLRYLNSKGFKQFL